MIPIEPIDPGGGDGEIEPPGTLPGLGSYLRRRYTCNLPVTEQVKAIDLTHGTVLLCCRGYLTQGPNGKIRPHSKKPVDFAFGTSAFPATDTVLDADDVSAWIGDVSKFLLIDPHTNKSEIREVISAVYDTAQNSVTLTTNEPTDIDITGFSGATSSVPATATIDFLNIVAGTVYTITLDGVDITATPSTSDSPITVSSFFTGAFRGHPRLNRKWSYAWDGASVITLTGRFGNLTVDALELAHSAPIADPTVAPTLAVGSGIIAAGEYRVFYTYRDEDGNETLYSPFTSISLGANQGITLSSVTPPADCTVRWYVSVGPSATNIRFHSENDGSSFTIETLPKLDDPLPPDLNRTGCEVMRVQSVFSDREETRSATSRANVLRGSFEWSLTDQKKRYNRVDLPYRESSQDWRRVELRFHDKDHQSKIKKEESKEYNGNAIDTYFQAYRIGAGLLAELRDSFFRYKFSATREALLLEEGDVVAITDDGSGLYNLPVMIEKIECSLNKAGLPKATFTATLFANTLYDDSVVERTIPVIAEIDVEFTPGEDLTVGTTIFSSTDFSKTNIHWFNTDGDTAVSETVISDAVITVG